VERNAQRAPVGRPPLNPDGGEASVLRVRTPDADLDRLTRLAKHFGVPFSQMVRVAVQKGLIELEREQPPPDDGG